MNSRWLLLLAMAASSTGCSQLMGGLRPDLNDQPSYESQGTEGGRWAERGFLDDGTVGHDDRSPASMSNGVSNDEWVDSTRSEQNRRDDQRGADGEDGQQVSFSNTPNLPPSTRRLYKNGNRATAADFIDQSPNEGSLWASDGQTNYYFTKNKVRGVGDIVTVNIEAELLRDIGNEVKRTLTEQEKDIEMSLAQERANERAAGTKSDSVTTSQAAPVSPQAPANGATGQSPDNQASAQNGTGAVVTPGDIDVTKSLDVKAGDTMMAEIVERYPNGNYKIRAIKKLNYRNGAPRLMTLTGVVRGSDIGEDDTVASGKLYEYRLQAIR